ncbi:MAG TPA: SDR family NAD(P)-dependent oxidoreductase [Polyangiales bacterium]|nr:SDR family NAD(P)-dependent oxidoreductase [Polyangiales bacterium]
MPNQQTKTTIVTGAARGIGAAIAERLAADSFAVVVNFAGSAAEAENVVTRIRTAGGSASAIRADVSDPVAVRSLFDQSEAAFGPCDVLVNNAGIMQLSSIAEATDEFFDRQIAVNLKGVFNCLREAARRMRGGGFGRISERDADQRPLETHQPAAQRFTNAASSRLTLVSSVPKLAPAEK